MGLDEDTDEFASAAAKEGGDEECTTPHDKMSLRVDHHRTIFLRGRVP